MEWVTRMGDYGNVSVTSLVQALGNQPGSPNITAWLLGPYLQHSHLKASVLYGWHFLTEVKLGLLWAK